MIGPSFLLIISAKSAVSIGQSLEGRTESSPGQLGSPVSSGWAFARQVREWPASRHENRHGGLVEGSMIGGRRIRDEWVFRRSPSDVATGETKSKVRRDYRGTVAPIGGASHQVILNERRGVKDILNNQQIARTYLQMLRSRIQLSPPNWSVYTRRTITGLTLISIRVRVLPHGLTPHRFLATTPSFDNGDQIPTTEVAGPCSLPAECGHRWPESREGRLERHNSQSCFGRSQHPSHNDPGTFPPLL